MKVEVGIIGLVGIIAAGLFVGGRANAHLGPYTDKVIRNITKAGSA